jgi:hypothetical protein
MVERHPVYIVVVTGYSGALFSTKYEFFYPLKQYVIICGSIVALQLPLLTGVLLLRI